MTIIHDIANVLEIGGCVVMGIGVAPERYRLLLQGATNQDYMIVGRKDSADAKFIASMMSSERVSAKPLTILGQELDVYLIRSDEHAIQETDEAGVGNGSKSD